MILIKVNILNELCIFDMSQIENDEKILIDLFNVKTLSIFYFYFFMKKIIKGNDTNLKGEMVY